MNDIIASMLVVNSRERATAEGILKHKIMQLRGQDYSLRLQFNQAKLKFEKNSEELKQIHSQIEEQQGLIQN